MATNKGRTVTAKITFSRIALTTVLIGGLSACSSLGLGGNSGSAVQQASRINGSETVAVNRYLWAASLEVLGFLPVESIDPFTGVIVFGYGTPPGGSRAYRATVHVSNPALDARSLNVALQTRSGAVAEDTQRAIEDAILTRARQLRIADRGL